MTVYSSCVLGA
ncbi:hypothetical protein NP493_2594g00000 [Ridgeia piscesae]|uniref:Uncharacterized protein n=1 Tax=Ridgeia piscesae TaxID=27915 RepID=A0AAD9N2A7_RIDPI|nr:hypothetical protein NP493_2594g00000 [Ridgeia piscesae]